MKATESHLKCWDVLILVGFLVISLAIGVYHSLTGGRQKTTAEFIMADRRLKLIPTAMSLLVSVFSAILLLGMTAEMYSYGVQYVIFMTVSVTFALLFVERIIVPWIYSLKLVSVYDYLEKRYRSKSVRMFGVSLGILNGILITGIAMYAPSAALESASGLPLSVSIPAMAVVAVTYTALGGMRAVIWTDVFQFIAIFIGLAVICIKGLVVVGGITNVFRLAEEEGRLVWANVSVDPRVRHTVFSLVIGTTFNFINVFGLSQAAVQRYSAVDTLSNARKMVLITIPAVIVLLTVTGLIGLIVLAYYSSVKCDPLANKDIANPNILLPYFVVTIFDDSPGFLGLFLSTLYGATLSTVSSLLSGSAANCWEDLLKWKLNHLPETRKTFINKLLVALLGAISTGVAFFSASVPGPITQVVISMSSSVKGPLFAVFVLGALSKHANWKGTLLGGIVGAIFSSWLIIGSLTLRHRHPSLPPVSVENCSTGNNNGSSTLLANYTYYEVADGTWSENNWNETAVVLSEARSHVTQLRGLENFYALSYMWFLPLGAVVTGVIGIIASLIMRDRSLEEEVDGNLLLRFRGVCGWSAKREIEEDVADEDNGCASKTQEANSMNQVDALESRLLFLYDILFPPIAYAFYTCFGDNQDMRPETQSFAESVKSVARPGYDCPNDMEMMALQKTEKRFHEELKGDLKKETEDEFVAKDDPGEKFCIYSTC